MCYHRVYPPCRLPRQVSKAKALSSSLVAPTAGPPPHPADAHYDSLHTRLKPIPRTDPTHALLDQYMQQTHAATHSSYTLELTQAFEVEREGEKEAFKDVGNRKLLWHGSRLTNWAGILSGGLRIAPPEAPATGYMFGKGLYFADMSSKSANYCFATAESPEVHRRALALRGSAKGTCGPGGHLS